MRLTFQEDEVGHLNRVIELQGVELRALKDEVSRLKRLVAVLAPYQVSDRADETPPHY
jgi:uncharacterized coiled-coil protein SlyX